MLGVFLTQDRLVCWDFPINTQGTIKDTYATICLGMIELITLILEYCRVAKDGKAMSHTLGNEELTVVFLCEFHRYMLSVGGTALADVNNDIEDCALDTTHEFALRVGRALEMKTTHDAVSRHTLVVLHEIYCMSKDWCHLLIELPLGEGLKEIASGILEDAWLYD